MVDFILHIDRHLQEFIELYHMWVYAFLFLIIFLETGLVILPFLPGDSLLFAVGMFAAHGAFNIVIILVSLFVAAVLGDTLNYYLGKYFGKKLMSLRFRGNFLVKEKDIEKTHAFYEKNGPKTIIIARFLPIVRSFAPFVAGIGSMNYRTFFIFNILGGFIWVFSLTLLGFYLGDFPIVKENFELVVIFIMVVSALPVVYEIIKSRFKKVEA